MRDLLRSLSVRTFRETISTPDPEALGGAVTLTIRGDGRYVLTAHMHDSGFPDYSFRLGIFLRGESGKIAFALYSRGEVNGTMSSGSRDFDERKENVLPALVEHWDDFSRGTFTVHREYSNDLTGWIESAFVDVSMFLIGCVTLGAPAACVIFGASLLEDVTGAALPGELGMIGLIAAQGATYLCGPMVFVPVFIAGALVSAAVFKRRRISGDEIAAARSVFEDTIEYDRVWFTNMESEAGRAFASPCIDGSIMIGMAGAYDNALATKETRKTMIHELTHAWQIKHSSLMTMVCTVGVERARRVTEGDAAVYTPESFTAPWDSYTWEQQAVLVSMADFWRQELTRSGLSYENLPTERFIRDHILMV